VTKPNQLALGIGAAGCSCGIVAGLVAFPVDWLLAWTAFSCFLATGAYLGNRPEVLGKSQGRISALRALPALPYLVAMRIACALMRRHRRFPPLSRVTDDLWVGGRCGLSDLPGRVGLVVDLTAESSAPAPIRVLPGYRNLPVLDGAVPADEDAVLALLDEIAAAPGAVVVHCDSGVGRAPTLAALALLRLGVASDVEHALALVKESRPMARPTSVDRSFLARLALRVTPAEVSAGARSAPARSARAVGA
jgi:protein-tyrosine phosphatase